MCDRCLINFQQTGLTTFERRERLLTLVRKQPGVRVSELAQTLAVSQGTIRNDMEALQDSGRLKRVHGGAVTLEGLQAAPSDFVARAQANVDAKERIARWAADLVSDGDSIMLDSSTTVYRLAPFLHDRHSLTVVTNGLEVARLLAQNPTNTVILLGGHLRADGTTVAGALAEQQLHSLHVRLAIVSATGISPEIGLTDDDLAQARLKGFMVGAADTTIALVDSSKFGRRNLAPFAQVNQVARIYTDDDLEPQWIGQFQRTAVTLTLCGAETMTSYAPASQEDRHVRVGFANLTETLLFAQVVRRGLERAATRAATIDLVVADNNLSAETALQVADSLVAQQPDIVIEYQLDTSAGDVIMAKFRSADIPVIAVDIPLVGATFFGVDNYRAGQLAGTALGRWVQLHWNSEFDRLVVLEEPRAGALPAARILGQLDSVREVLGPIDPARIVTLESGNVAEVSEAAMLALLDQHPELRRFAVICFNDPAALGAIAAARTRGREEQIVVVGQGADRRARSEIRRRGSRLIGSTAYMPEQYGERLIALAQQIVRREPVPPAVYMDHVFITAENVDAYYPD